MRLFKKRLIRKLAEKVDEINLESSKEEEEFFYVKAAEEIYSGNFRKGLYFKIFSECDGDEKVTKARYIKERCLELLREKQSIEKDFPQDKQPSIQIKALKNNEKRKLGLLDELKNDFNEIFNEQ